ncbi:MAG TPA: GIY-YIG nuclease family protein [Thermomicrobiales bacterium]|nr:GIY-YIG nuclease family protein [Thermomicrobiales bacterium]
MEHTFYVYILASDSFTLYIGITNNLERRMWEHKTGFNDGSFTSKYGIHRLVHIEDFADVRDAIAREKQLKGWNRAKKIALIERANPYWHDLSREW